MNAFSVVQVRGSTVESIHPVSVAACDPDGHSVVGVPEDSAPVTWRSAAKPFQLEVSLECIGETFAPEILAVGASSHHAEARHIERVAELLRRFGLNESALRCGAHWPTNEAAGHQLVLQHRTPTALHNNCSGKHAFMAIACLVQGWSPEYLDPRHPLQVRIAERIAARTGEPVRVVTAGCGAPCFVLSLRGMARAWAQLGAAIAEESGGLGKIGTAMAAHPWLVSGVGATDGSLMAVSGGKLIAKIGAEGLLCLAIPERRWGIAIKCWSGRSEPRLPAALAILGRWAPGLLASRDLEAALVVQNWVGLACGRWDVQWPPTEHLRR